MVHGRELDDAERVSDELQTAFGIRALAVAFDLADRQGPAGAIRQIKGEFGQLNGLVVNAGVHAAGLIGMIGDDEIDRTLGVNVGGALRTLQSATKLMRRSGGSVVMLSSIMGTRGGAGQSLYAASKSAIVGLARSAAKELGPLGIRVNAVAPGFIETDMMGTLDSTERSSRLDATALGRFGTADDVAHLIDFLVGDRSSFITGQVVGVDGGIEP